MRTMVAVLALCAAACAPAPNESGEAGGYTLEIRASGAEQTYLITAPDGAVVGARAAEGASALMDNQRAQRLVGDPPPQGDQPPEVMSLRLPGFEMNVNAEEDDAQGDRGRVAIRLGGEGRNIVVNADEGGPGEADDRAYVRITGADERTVREFIEEADELSLEVRAAMLSELGLSAAAPER